MAEGLLRQMGGDLYEAFSAGVEPDVVHPMAVEAMREVGIDISTHRSKSLQEYIGRVHFSYLITVCSEGEARCPTAFPGMGHRLFWNIADPVDPSGTEGEQLARFRQARDSIIEHLTRWLAVQV